MVAASSYSPDYLAFARLTLGSLRFIGDANRFPKVILGSFLTLPSGKCLKHTRNCTCNWLLVIPSTHSYPSFLGDYSEDSESKHWDRRVDCYRTQYR